jgi:hypothetical protein
LKISYLAPKIIGFGRHFGLFRHLGFLGKHFKGLNFFGSILNRVERLFEKTRLAKTPGSQNLGIDPNRHHTKYV